MSYESIQCCHKKCRINIADSRPFQARPSITPGNLKEVIEIAEEGERSWRRICRHPKRGGLLMEPSVQHEIAILNK